jgi:CHAT domain-containing protein/tetratricopeptide (TPR) repeat protein
VSPPQVITHRQTIELSGQSATTQQLAIPADTEVEIQLRMRNVDVRAELRADDRALLRADAPNDRAGVITLHLPAGSARATELRVVGEDHAANRGSVTLQVLGLPVASGADRTRLAAVRAEAAACAAFGDPARAQQAAAQYGEAAQLRRKIGDHAGVGRNLLQEAGVRFQSLSEWQRSGEQARAAARLLRQANESALEVRAMRLEGAAIHAIAETLDGRARDATYEAARRRLTIAAQLAEQRGLPYEAAFAFNYRGVTYQYQGRAAQAQADYERALELFRSAGHAPGQSMSIGSLALLHHEQGEFRAAIARFDEALALTSEAESPVSYAYTLYSSALPLRVLGQFDAAIARYQRAGELLRALGDPSEEARALHGIALVLRHAGEPERARVLLAEALRIQETVRNTRETFTALVALADIDREAGRHSDAVALLDRARPLAGQPHQQARVLLDLAEIERATGDPASAEEQLRQVLALELPPAHPRRGRAWLALASVAAHAGRGKEAQNAFAEALRVAEQNGAELEQVDVLSVRAEFQLTRGETAAALADSARAIEILEAVGAAGSHGQQRAVFLATRRRAYELQIAGLLAIATADDRAGRAAAAAQGRMAALEASERSRMGTLLEALARTTAEVPSALVDERTRLVELLAGKRQRRETLLDRVPTDPRTIAALSRGIELLRVELGAVEAEIGRLSGSGAPRGTAGSVERLLGRVPTTDLVAEYFLGDHHSWLFLVRDGNVTVHPLLGAAAIDDAVRTLVAGLRSADATDGSEMATPLRATYPGPLREAGAAARVWLVPDGALHAVPLAALPGIVDANGWLAAAEIVVVPSLRAVELAALRPRTLASQATIAVIADPIFEADDPRIQGVDRRQVASLEVRAATGLRTRASTRLDSLQRLPASADEGRAIAALVASEQSVLLIGADATREAVLGTALRAVRYLHFATHGVADAQDPELSALVVSQFAADGRPQDGAVRLHDLTGLELDAEVVVLSACETALGRAIRGEGLVGLSHGFLRAGARTVVASLWPVADTATAVLMQEFYRQLIIEQQRPATALRRAQAYVRSQPRWAAPYYWAGFQVVTVDPSSMATKIVHEGERT